MAKKEARPPMKAPMKSSGGMNNSGLSGKASKVLKGRAQSLKDKMKALGI